MTIFDSIKYPIGDLRDLPLDMRKTFWIEVGLPENKNTPLEHKVAILRRIIAEWDEK